MGLKYVRDALPAVSIVSNRPRFVPHAQIPVSICSMELVIPLKLVRMELIPPMLQAPAPLALRLAVHALILLNAHLVNKATII